jgi:hypothetical protein
MAFRGFGKSKAKAALARANYIETTDLTILQSDVDKLEKGEYTVRVTSMTSSGSISIVSGLVLCDATAGNIIVTMPDLATVYSSGYSRYFSISKIDDTSNTVTIIPHSTGTIVSEGSFTLVAQNEIISLVTNGTNWYLVD